MERMGYLHPNFRINSIKSLDMKVIHHLFAVLIVIAFNSCGEKKEADFSAPSGNFRNEAGAAGGKELEEKAEAESIERKLIKKGDIAFQTNDIEKSRQEINKAVSELKGYISKDNVYSYSNRTGVTLEIRLPADNFDKLMERVSSNAERIERKNVDVMDVTEEYIDVEARLKTKKEVEIRYRELLAQAKSVNDVLNIERELGNLRSEIESIEGRLRYLKDQVAFSTLTVEFYKEKIGGSDFGFWQKIKNAGGNGWELLLMFLVGIAHLWPFMLLALAIIYLIRWIRKRRKQIGMK